MEDAKREKEKFQYLFLDIEWRQAPVANVMQGNEEKAVLEKFVQTFPKYCYLIVWSRDNYDLFLRDMREMVEMELKMKNMEEKDYGYDNMPELRRANIG